MTKKARTILIIPVLVLGSLFVWMALPKKGIAVPGVTVEQFSPSPNEPLGDQASTQEPVKPTWTLLATGDVLLARTVNTKTLKSGDFRWPFLFTADTLRAADLTFVNLETPLTSECRPTDSGMLFCGDTRHIEGLKFSGVDIINIANNHASNQGLDGVEETDTLLTAAGFLVTGREDDPVFTTVHGLQVAFLGFNEVNEQEGINRAIESDILKKITLAKTKADVVIVQFHWGNEYTRTPSENQKRLGRLSIDAGANLVIGNHPHWWQPSESYNEGLIVYSHGNFIFDQMWSMETRQGLVGKYTFSGNKLSSFEFLPVQIDNYGQPHWLEGEPKETILQDLQNEQKRLSVPTSL